MVLNIVKYLPHYQFLPKFLFQPDSIDGYEFHPIPIDIRLRIIKISTKEFLDDYGKNTTETK